MSAEGAPPYRWKFALFFCSAILILVASNVVYQGCDTLRRLDVVEAERDTWQRPAEILGALIVKPAAQVVDLGCGAGYFALKLSSLVGPHGKVMAVDIRAEPLVFLWLRAIQRSPRNITVSRAEPLDPHLAADSADAVLVANTYHELADPPSMLAHMFRALHRDGRVVIADRAPTNAQDGGEASHHVAPNIVAGALRQAGLAVIREDDHFTVDPGGEVWWLIVARKP
jgi:ubiquinone/menaquinone biosynthesis C-methylase UbiE